MIKNGYRIKAVLFDFDGTLTQPDALDFDAIRKALGCPQGQPVLEYIQSLADTKAQKAAMVELIRFETEAAATSVPVPGAETLVRYIKQQGLGIGIITRNSRASVLKAFDNFDTIKSHDFDLIITRDDPHEPKPSGDGIQWAARQFNVAPQEILVVGDYVFDTQASRNAGAMAVLIDDPINPRFEDEPCDFRIRDIDDLRPIIRDGLPLTAGKLPNDMLHLYLQENKFNDPSVLVPPGVGEDITAVDVSNTEVLVLKSDPITFAAENISQYAVLVNANDIVTAGALPRWFLTTLLLPCGATPSQVRYIMGELAAVCRQWEITLCGGHTEVTDTVNRAVVVGMMAGTVCRDALIEKTGMRSGDCVILTKQVAVEGTAIIAREFEAQLRQQGISGQQIALGREMLSKISILPEARLAAQDHLATAMHDVTEGGLATALKELSVAGGHGIVVDKAKIPIFELTRKFCKALGLHPLGLIGSGSLLICCRPNKCQLLIQRLTQAGIDACQIGCVSDPESGIEAYHHGRHTAWPQFEVDEITRLY